MIKRFIKITQIQILHAFLGLNKNVTWQIVLFLGLQKRTWENFIFCSSHVHICICWSIFFMFWASKQYGYSNPCRVAPTRTTRKRHDQQTSMSKALKTCKCEKFLKLQEKKGGSNLSPVSPRYPCSNHYLENLWICICFKDCNHS